MPATRVGVYEVPEMRTAAVDFVSSYVNDFLSCAESRIGKCYLARVDLLFQFMIGPIANHG